MTQRNPEWILREYLVLHAHHGSQCSKEESRTKALDILIRNSKWLFDVIQKKSRQGGFLDKNSWKRFVDVANRNASELQHMLGASTESVQDEEEEAMDVDSDRDDFDEGLNLTVRDRVELGIESVNDILTKLKKNQFKSKDVTKGGPISKKQRRQQRPHLPAFLYRRPTFEAGCPWICPGLKCDFVIDFRLVEKIDFSVLSSDDTIWIKHNHSNPHDARFAELFGILVEAHYFRHMDDLGIGLFTTTTENDMFGQEISIKKRMTKMVEVPLSTKVSLLAVI